MKYEAPGGQLTGALAVFDLVCNNVTTADPVNTGFSVATGQQRLGGGLEKPNWAPT